jgi:hypothetical protein
LPGVPNGFGGTFAALSAALPAGFGFAEAAGFTLVVAAGAGVGAAGSPEATDEAAVGGGTSGDGGEATETVTAGLEARDGLSVLLRMIAPAVPTTTQTPRSTRQTRTPRLAFERGSVSG